MAKNQHVCSSVICAVISAALAAAAVAQTTDGQFRFEAASVKRAPDGNDLQNLLADLLRIPPGRFRIDGVQQPLPSLASILSRMLGRPVVDETGLAGKFNFKVDFTPDERVKGPMGEDLAPQPPGDAGEDLFAALQEQVGLKLEQVNGPVEILVVDHAQRVPTEN
jgi:uncharacterized protein (TIGR03435 family)